MEHVKAEIGMGATINLHSDRHACTIVNVSKDGKKITIQQDIATLDKSFSPEIIPGGFVGHCTNQDDQTYTYQQDTNATKIVFSLRKNGRYVEQGYKIGQGNTLTIGIRKEFYDYSF